MVTMWVMEMAVMEIIDVISMLYGGMTAVRAMLMCVIRVLVTFAPDVSSSVDEIFRPCELIQINISLFYEMYI